MVQSNNVPSFTTGDYVRVGQVDYRLWSPGSLDGLAYERAIRQGYGPRAERMESYGPATPRVIPDSLIMLDGQLMYVERCHVQGGLCFALVPNAPLAPAPRIHRSVR